MRLIGLLWLGASLLAADPPAPAGPPERFQWTPALRQANFFLCVQNGFRLATEPGTRQELEDRTRNRFLRILARGFLNPNRSFANLMRFRPPWYRDQRAGVVLR